MRGLLISVFAVAGVLAFASVARAGAGCDGVAAKPLDVAGPISTPIKLDTTTTSRSGG
jgi:hypothetical protein